MPRPASSFVGRERELSGVLAEIGNGSAIDELSCRLREHHLPPVCRRPDSCREVHVVTDVAFLGNERRPRVQADAQADLAVGERFGHHLRCSNCSSRRWKREEECVTLRVHFDAVFGGASVADDAAVFSKSVCVPLRSEFVQEPR